MAKSKKVKKIVQDVKTGLRAGWTAQSHAGD
jgi:hypothetical protein